MRTDLTNRIDAHHPYRRNWFPIEKGEIVVYLPTTMTDEEGERMYEKIRKALEVEMQEVAVSIRTLFPEVSVPTYRFED